MIATMKKAALWLGVCAVLAAVLLPLLVAFLALFVAAAAAVVVALLFYKIGRVGSGTKSKK